MKITAQRLQHGENLIMVTATWPDTEAAPSIQRMNAAARGEIPTPTSASTPSRATYSKLTESGGHVKGEHYWNVTYIFTVEETA